MLSSLNTFIQLPTTRSFALTGAHPRLVDNRAGVLGLEPIDNEPDLDVSYEPYYFPPGTTGADNSIRELADQIFTHSKAGKDTEPNLTAAAVRVVAAAGDDEIHSELVSLYRQAPTPQLEVGI